MKITTNISLYYKIRERKVKTLTRNWRDHWRIDTREHMETVSRHFDRHSRLYQSEESKCFWTHDKDGITSIYIYIYIYIWYFEESSDPLMMVMENNKQ